MSAHITHLPTEIFEAVIDACPFDKNEYLQLRLVCKTFANFVTPRAFQTLRLQDFTKEAFDNVFKVSQSRLRSHVTHFEYKLIETKQECTQFSYLSP